MENLVASLIHLMGLRVISCFLRDSHSYNIMLFLLNHVIDTLQPHSDTILIYLVTLHAGLMFVLKLLSWTLG